MSILLTVTRGESSSVGSLDQQVGVALNRPDNLLYSCSLVGVAIVTPLEAYLWTDGRYHLQASQELDSALWTLMRQGNMSMLSEESV